MTCIHSKAMLKCLLEQTHQGPVVLDLLFKVSSKVSHGLLLF